jgi:hypothetical protein
MTSSLPFFRASFLRTLNAASRYRATASLGGIALTLLLLALPGCNSLNPLCGSARPAPSISSLAPDTLKFSDVDGYVLTVNGGDFVAASIVVINGTNMTTTIKSSSELQVTLNTTLIGGPGTFAVAVNTPSGNSGNLGCTSGGTSKTLTLTIT